jgi:hypothetical protein
MSEQIIAAVMQIGLGLVGMAIGGGLSWAVIRWADALLGPRPD